MRDICANGKSKKKKKKGPIPTNQPINQPNRSAKPDDNAAIFRKAKPQKRRSCYVVVGTMILTKTKNKSKKMQQFFQDHLSIHHPSNPPLPPLFWGNRTRVTRELTFAAATRNRPKNSVLGVEYVEMQRVKLKSIDHH